MKTKHFKTSSFYVMPKDLNGGGTLFGGRVLAEMDCEMAKVASSIIFGTEANNIVTACFDKTNFLHPGHQNDLIVLEADVYELGKTSIKIKCNVYIWQGLDRTQWKLICETTSVFVALKDGKPFPHGKTLENEKETGGDS